MGNFIGVGGLLQWKQKYLLVRHTYGEYKDHWILPGGHVKPGEHMDHAIIREFKEETNLEIHPLGILAVRSRLRKTDCTDCYIVFLLEYVSGSPMSDNFENDAVQLFSIEEIQNLKNIIPLSKIIIENYHQEARLPLQSSFVFKPYLPENEKLKLFL